MGYVNERHFYRPISTDEVKPFTAVFTDFTTADSIELVSCSRTLYETGSGAKDLAANCGTFFDYDGHKAVTVASVWGVGDTPAVGIYRVELIARKQDTTKKQEINIVAHII